MEDLRPREKEEKKKREKKKKKVRRRRESGRPFKEGGAHLSSLFFMIDFDRCDRFDIK